MENMNKEKMLLLAEEIATNAHKGQFDKVGVEYINHPRTVSSICNSPDAKIVGWLHDVVEDTEITFDDLVKEGFSDAIIEALKCVTKTEGYDISEYYFKIKNNPIAKEVKLADLTHNSDLSRLPENAPEELKKKLQVKHKQYMIYKAYLMDAPEEMDLNTYIRCRNDLDNE